MPDTDFIIWDKSRGQYERISQGTMRAMGWVPLKELERAWADGYEACNKDMSYGMQTSLGEPTPNPYK